MISRMLLVVSRNTYKLNCHQRVSAGSDSSPKDGSLLFTVL